MSKREILAGATDQTIDVFINDSSSAVGAGLSGLVFNSSGLKCYYRKGATGSATQLTLATQTVGGAHSDGGFVEIDATNMKGAYRVDLSDTIVATAGMVTIYLYGATNMAPCVLEIEVVSVNKFDSVRLGLTALPNAAAGGNGGLPTVDGSNYVAGIQGTKNQLDDLNDVSTAQVNTEADTALSDVGLTTTITGRVDAAITTRATPAQVNTEVLDVMNVDTFAEIGQEAPAATQTIRKMLAFLYKAWRNKKDSDGTTEKLYNDDAATVDQKRTIGESGGTVTKGEVATGP